MPRIKQPYIPPSEITSERVWQSRRLSSTSNSKYWLENLPETSWVKIAPNEYGFYAKGNGYGEQVADLYSAMDLKRYY